MPASSIFPLISIFHEEPGPCVFHFNDATRDDLKDVICAGFRGQSTVKLQMKENEKTLYFQLFVTEQQESAQDVAAAKDKESEEKADVDKMKIDAEEDKTAKEGAL